MKRAAPSLRIGQLRAFTQEQQPSIPQIHSETCHKVISVNNLFPYQPPSRRQGLVGNSTPLGTTDTTLSKHQQMNHLIAAVKITGQHGYNLTTLLTSSMTSPLYKCNSNRARSTTMRAAPPSTSGRLQANT